MLYRLLVVPRPNAVPPRHYTRCTVQSVNLLFFAQLRRNISREGSGHPLISGDVNSLLQRAKNFERSRNYVEAETIYREIVYKIDPTRQEAYDHLANLWSKKSVFGLTQDRLDDLFQQYEKHVKKTEPTSQGSEKFKPK